MKAINVLALLFVLNTPCFGQGKWFKKGDFPGIKRSGAFSFVIAEKAYIGGGLAGPGQYLKDVWEYDPTLDTWSQKTNFSGDFREYYLSFVINGKGYVGLGIGKNNIRLNDLWQYYPDDNTWTRKKDFTGQRQLVKFNFVLNQIVYIGMKNYISLDVWEYNAQRDVWLQKKDFVSKTYTGSGTDAGFAINGKGYVFINSLKKLWEYNYAIDKWREISEKSIAISKFLTINNQVFGIHAGNLYEYDYQKNIWLEKERIDGTGSNSFYAYSTSFALKDKLYNVCGALSDKTGAHSRFYEYDLKFFPAITSLFARATTNGVYLTWKDEFAREEKYEIYRSTTPESGYIKISELEANANSYEDQQVVNDVTYFYRIRPINVTENFKSSFSNEAYATTSSAAISGLVAPYAPSATALSVSTIQIDWSDYSSRQEDVFEIYSSTEKNGKYNKVGVTPRNVTTYVDSNLDQNTTYYYKILSKDGSLVSDFSLIVNATTLKLLPPTAPINLTAQITTSNQIELRWQDQANNEIGFELYRSLNIDSAFTKIWDLTTNTIGYVDQNVDEGTTYYYKIRAINSSGNSGFSNIIAVSTNISGDIVLQAYSQLPNTINLKWITDNPDVEGYVIERFNVDESLRFVEVAIINNVSEYIDKELLSKETYFYRIRAFKGSSFSQYSNRIGANTLVTGINETLSQHIKVLNNPNSTGVFQVKTEGLNTQNWQVALRDGQMKSLPQHLVLRNDKGYQIDLSQKSTGTYFLIFDTPKGKAIKKLLKR
ncbi:hypothetical protein BKI52_03980 [marine bacterium AO1-C]|nr:hypothetical protein BKI52_03980 [marine bacterium AO1-C]